MVFGKNSKFVKKVDGEAVEVEALVTEEPADLNSTGFSMIKHPEGGFAVVTLKFNPITMLAKVELLSPRIDSRMEAEDVFKIQVSQYFAEQESRS